MPKYHIELTIAAKSEEKAIEAASKYTDKHPDEITQDEMEPVEVEELEE